MSRDFGYSDNCLLTNCSTLCAVAHIPAAKAIITKAKSRFISLDYSFVSRSDAFPVNFGGRFSRNELMPSR